MVFRRLVPWTQLRPETLDLQLLSVRSLLRRMAICDGEIYTSVLSSAPPPPLPPPSFLQLTFPRLSVCQNKSVASWQTRIRSGIVNSALAHNMSVWWRNGYMCAIESYNHSFPAKTSLFSVTPPVHILARGPCLKEG